MSLKDEFLVALRAGADYDALMELVRRHRVTGLTIDAAYQALEEIWMDHGFNKTVSEEGSMQDTLETVMEKVWYGQPVI